MAAFVGKARPVKTAGAGIILLVSLMALIASCGGGRAEGGPEADSMSLSVDNGPVIFFVEAPSATAPPDIGKDPYIWSRFDAARNSISLFTYAAYNGPIHSTTLEIDISSASTGTYSVTAAAAVYYTAPDGSFYFASPFFTGSDGTVVVTRYDSAPGGRIQGSFDVTAVVRVLLHERTARLTGSFDVTID